MTEKAVRVGVDLGGHKIEIIAIDRNRQTLVRRRVPTPSSDYGAIVATIGTLVEEVERELRCTARVGIGTPGSTSPHTGRITGSNTTALIGKPLRGDLERRLNREVRMTNDANCFVRSEALDGAATGAEIVFGVILGTGVGGGISFARHVRDGRNAIAGEWGHNPLPWALPGESPGPRCYCGKHGCIETFLSGPALARSYAERFDEAIDAREIARRDAAGDASAHAILEIYENRLARALATIVNTLDPDVIVLGGGLSNIERLYFSVPALLPTYAFSDRVDTPIVKAAHGDSSGVRGAAMLWE